MKLQLFAIRDRATIQFDRPMAMLSEPQAIRGFTDGVNEPAADNYMFKHPEDFDLYYIGDFDTDTGLIRSDVPRQVATGKDAKRSVADVK